MVSVYYVLPQIPQIPRNHFDTKLVPITCIVIIMKCLIRLIYINSWNSDRHVLFQQMACEMNRSHPHYEMKSAMRNSRRALYTEFTALDITKEVSISEQCLNLESYI